MARISSQGTKLQVEISTVFTDIPQITGFNFPTVNRQYEDATALDSSGNFKEFTALMIETGEVTAEMFWDPANSVHDFLMDEAIKATAVLLNFKAIASDAGAATMAFSGYVSYEPTAQQNSSLKATLTVRVSGALTYTQ